ncbi:MAG: ComEC/Rec2 family competence protein [Parcubacteria group bacterium]|jgi:competence protein ComEC
MPNRKALYLILLTLAIIAAILAGIIWYQQKQEMKVVFFDVGQGDSILIEQGSNQILIDGGPDGKKVMEKLGEYVPFWDRNIEVVIATHPDEDHIDGLIDVMENYNIGEIIDNGADVDSQVYKKYQDVISQKNINRIEGKSGMEIKLADNTKLSILSPDGTQDKNNPKDTNLSSIVSKLTFGENSFLFTGDFPTEGEQDLFSKNIDLRARVLKVAHHGSKYATSDEFLDKVNPQEAVISVGKNNRYGHPAEDVISRLEAHKINIKRTDVSGDIEYQF